MSEILYVGKFKKSSTSTEDSIIRAMNKLGHTVTKADYLMEEVPQFADSDYDLAMFSKCETVDCDTIKKFRCKKAMWIFDGFYTTIDPLGNLGIREGAEKWTEKAKLMDCLFTSSPGDVETYQEMGCANVKFLPQACDDGIFRDLGLDRNLEITFVGNNYGKLRGAQVRKIYRRYAERFKLFSKTGGWDMPVERGLDNRGAAEMFNRSVITLNISEVPSKDQWSSRVWSAMGCGAVMLAQNCPSYSRFFDEEMLTWEDLDGLFSLIDSLLDDPERTKRISGLASSLILSEHTYVHRVRELFSQMGLEA